MSNGELRLLFSSKQIEYLRYWLQSMGLTRQLLPMPNTNYLLLQNQLKSVSPIMFRTPTDLKNAQKVRCILNGRTTFAG